MRFRNVAGFAAASLSLFCTNGWADDPRAIYSNIDTETRFSRNASDVFVWDDLQLVGGGLLTGLTLVADNSRPTLQPGSLIEIQFRLFDDLSGGPIGSLIGTVIIDYTNSTYEQGSNLISTDDLGSFGVVLPPDEVIAVGVNFNDPTGSMGVVTFDPPTVGASSEAAWVGSDPTAIFCEGIVGAPVPCSFGWQLRSTMELADPVTEVVDNLEADKTRMVGLWRESEGKNPYAGSSVYGHHDAATFTWTPRLLNGSGDYLVEVYWTFHPKRSSNVPYCIDAENAITCVEFDQSDEPAAATWQEMGRFTCVTTSCEVTVSAVNGQASADAVRWTKVLPLIVDQKNGTIGSGDPCPVPRTSARYSELAAAVDCAHFGDTVRIRPGRYVGPPVQNHRNISLKIIGSGADQTILDGEGQSIFNVFTGDFEIQGLTFTDANASDGGGVDNEADGKVVIKSCVFAGNNGSSGAGLANAGEMRIYNSVFADNSADNRGGAIINQGSGQLRIFRSTIVRNTAASGGGLFNTGSASVTVVNSLISENEGAGIYNESSGTVKLIRTVLQGNSPADCFGCP